MSTLRTAVLAAGALAVGAGAVAAAVVGLGLYPVGATREHFQIVHSLLETAMRHSVQRAARDVAVPDFSAGQVARGAQCFRQHCQQCHGGPGVAQGPIGRGMQPLPGPLADAHLRWRAREVYWITRHGIRMSGMPAWAFRLPDADIWALTAFVMKLPEMSPADYARATSAASAPLAPAAQAGSTDGCGFTRAERDAAPSRAPDLERGRTALSQYACAACHAIPGVTSSTPMVGPPLAGIGQRTLIAGRLANTPGNMVRWLRDPQGVDPLTAMPDLGVTEEDARDIAAYLASLR